MLWGSFGVRNSCGRLFLASSAELDMSTDLASHLLYLFLWAKQDLPLRTGEDPNPIIYIVLWHYGQLSTVHH